MDRAVHPGLRTTPRCDVLTIRRIGPTKDPDIPTSDVDRSPTPTSAGHQLKIVTRRPSSPSVDRGLSVPAKSPIRAFVDISEQLLGLIG